MSNLSRETAQQLAAAFEYPFGEPVTAFLTNAQIIAAACVGVTHRHVRADVAGQFQDGHRIRTSDIREVSRIGLFWCVHTLSGSLYVIVTFNEVGGEASLDAYLKLLNNGIHSTPRCYQ